MLPGSSIGAVYVDCAAHHADILKSATALARAAAASLAPHGAVFNSLAFARQQILELDSAAAFPGLTAAQQTSHTGKALYLQSLPSLGFCAVAPIEPTTKAEVRETKEVCLSFHAVLVLCCAVLTEAMAQGFVLQNEALSALITHDGLLRSLVHRQSGRESIAEGGAANQFVLFDDVPFYWSVTRIIAHHSSLASSTLTVTIGMRGMSKCTTWRSVTTSQRQRRSPS